MRETKSAPKKSGAIKPADLKPPKGELSEQELKSVAGGKGCAGGQHLPEVKG